MATKKATVTADEKSRLAQFLKLAAIQKLQDPKEQGVLITRASEFHVDVARVPTGIFPIDWALDGGMPFGRFIHIFGPQASFKTGVGLRLIANAQQQCATCFKPLRDGRLALFTKKENLCACKAPTDMICAFVDVEGTYDKTWGAIQGIDNDRLVYTLPDSLEDTADTMEAFIYSGVDVIVLDCIAFMSPEKEIEADMDQDLMALQARQLRKAIRKWTAASRAVIKDGGRRPMVVMLNHVTSKVGMVFGSTEAIPGGSAPRFAASVELKMIPHLTATEIDGTGLGALPSTTPISMRIEKNKLGGARMDGDFVLNLKTNDVIQEVAVTEDDKAAAKKDRLAAKADKKKEKDPKAEKEKKKAEKKKGVKVAEKKKGSITDEPFVLAIMKKVGMITGKPPYQILGRPFGKLAEVEIALYADPVFKGQVVAELMDRRGTLEANEIELEPEAPEAAPEEDEEIPEGMTAEDAG